jgi:hypothetical protein
MPQTNATQPPLGLVLQQAGLVSAVQVNAALEEQCSTPLRIGEILASHGWIKQESADFFALDWPQHPQTPRLKIGQYLQQAALLDQDQVESILDQQRREGLQFGTLAVMRGWVRSQTVDFFLRHAASGETLGTAELEHRAQRLSSQFSQDDVNPFALLLLYQQIVRQGQVSVDGSLEQAELLNVGLVQRDGDTLILTQTGTEPSLDLLTDSLEDHSNHLEQPEPRPYDRIRLRLLNLESCSARPYRVLAEVLSWTGNQPNLTQKLCQVIHESGRFIPAGVETERVGDLVQEFFIQHWQTSEAAEPLRALQQRLIHNQNCSPVSLLQFYDRLLRRSEISENSLEEQELLELGLIVKHHDMLHVATRIYKLTFNHAWVAQTLRSLAHQPSVAPVPDLASGSIPDSIPTSTAASVADAIPASVLALSPSDLAEPKILSNRDTSSVASSTGQRPLWRVFWSLIAGVLALSAFQLWRSSLLPNMTVPAAKSKPDPIAPDRQKPIKAAPDASSSNQSAVSQRSKAGKAPSLAGLQRQSGLPAAQPEQDSARTNTQPGVTSQPPQVLLRRQTQSTVSNSASPSVPVFVVGASRSQILNSLGPPTWDRQGYYDHSRALLYKGRVSKQIDLGYLLDSSTGKLRQTEMAFDPSVPLGTLQSALRQMLRGSLPASIQSKLKAVRLGQLRRYTFVLGGCEGEIHQDEKGWTYMGIWDATFH